MKHPLSDTVSHLIHSLIELKEEQAIEETKKLLHQGVDPFFIIKTCQKGLIQVGERFEEGEYFISGLMMAGEILHQITDIVSPFIKNSIEHSCSGRILIGTVQGDIHDIGKNLVTLLLRCHGFNVLDLGVDVAPSEFILTSRQFKPHIVALSCFLTSANDAAWETIHLIKKKSGLPENHYKTIVGGGMMSQRSCDYIGADAWASDARTGINYCLKIRQQCSGNQ